MAQTTKRSFVANAPSEEELINVMLVVAGFTRESFTLYMNTTAEIMAQNPLWVKKYLEDIIDANLVHIGYVIKDTRQEGIMGEYREAIKELKKKSLNSGTIQTPIIIDEDVIISEAGTIKVSILTNAMQIVKRAI